MKGDVLALQEHYDVYRHLSVARELSSTGRDST